MADRKEWERVCAPRPPFFKHVMLGLDADKGTVKWVRPVFNTGAYGGVTGIVPLRLSNGTIGEYVIVGCNGGMDCAFEPVGDERAVWSGGWSEGPYGRKETTRGAPLT